MFESIKSALDKAKTKSTGGSYKNILQLEAPATYVVRLLPNIKNPEESIFHYYYHGWNSIATGQYSSVVSPSTWGERCPVSELYFKLMREGSEAEKARAKANLSRREYWLVNAYVVNDPKKPENNGTIKVLRYGRQLDKIIQSAINGDDSEEFGARIFDLSQDGCSLRIKAELVSDKPGAPKYPTYTASKFLSPTAIEGLDEEKTQELYNNVFDLSTFVERKSVEEIKDFINKNFFDKPAAEDVEDTAVEGVDVEEDDVPYEETKTAKTVSVAKPTPAATVTPAKPASSHDDKVLALINGLNDI
jgi:hypothetical protein